MPPGSWAKILLPSALVSLARTRVGDLGAEHLDFAAVGLPQQSGDLSGKVGAVVHHRQQDAVDLELGFSCRLTLLMVDSSCSRPLAGQILRLDGDYDPVGGGQRVDREHPQGGLAVNEDM